MHGKIGRKTTTSSKEPQVNDQITLLHESLEFLMAIYTFPRFFQLFIWTSQRKFVDTTGKSVLKIIKLPSWKTLKIYSSLKSQNFRDTCPPGDTTNVFKFWQLSGAISLLNQNVSRGNDGFSLTGLCKKLKNGGRVYSPWKGRAEYVLYLQLVVNVHIFREKMRVFFFDYPKRNWIRFGF